MAMAEEAEECSHLQNLPYEIIEKIVCNYDLTIKDVFNLSATFEKTGLSQHIWKVKYQSTWPNGVACHSEDSNVFNDWFESCKYRQTLDKRVVKFLEDLPEMLSQKNIKLSASDFDTIMAMASENGSLSLSNVLDCLNDIYLKSYQAFSDSPFALKGVYTLTNRFYAKVAIEHLRHRQLEEEWQKLGPTYTPPEKIANFFEQWMDTTSEYLQADTVEKIQGLSDHIKSLLDKSHPLHKVPLSEQQRWATEELTNNQWSPMVCRDLLKFISDICFQRLGFKIIPMMTEEDLFIDRVRVLNHSSDIIMTVIYEAIARRFGVRCNIICSSKKLLITWTDSQELTSPIYRVDVKTGGLRVVPRSSYMADSYGRNIYYIKYSPNALLATMSNIYHFVKTDKHRVCRYKVRNRELLSIIYPTNPYSLLSESETYDDLFRYVDAEYNVTTEDLGDLKITPRHHMGKLKATSKRHLSIVSYPVGMICFDMEDLCACVVRSWDLTCRGFTERSQGVLIKRLNRLARPVYNCIAADGSERCIAQEDLGEMMSNCGRLTAIEDIIGCQFSHFDGFCYIPNSQMDEEYPDDRRLRLSYKKQQLGKHNNMWIFL